MKKFTRKEIMNGEGGSNRVFDGETAMEIVKKSSKHFMKTDDKVHKPMRDIMKKFHSKEEEKEWDNK